MKYLFDTNIVLAFVRQSKITKAVSEILNLTDDNQVFISIVTVGELWSIASQRQWSDLKRRQLQRFLDEYIRVSISDDELIRRYAVLMRSARINQRIIRWVHRPEIWAKTICGLQLQLRWQGRHLLQRIKILTI